MTRPAEKGLIQTFLSYVMGVSDAVALTTAFNGSVAGWQACYTNYPVTGNQLRDIAMRFLRERPQMRHLNAAYLIGQALAEAFPCSPGRR